MADAKQTPSDTDPATAGPGPIPPPQCRWIWNGKDWAEDPKFPHDCPAGQTCAPPTTPGSFIGEEVDTHCVKGPKGGP